MYYTHTHTRNSVFGVYQGLQLKTVTMKHQCCGVHQHDCDQLMPRIKGHAGAMNRL